MGEALMFRAGSGSGGEGEYNLITEVFKTNTSYSVPYGIKNNEISVLIFGGGGAGSSSHTGAGSSAIVFAAGGGAGGYMNKNMVKVTPGEIINIVIGAGGALHETYTGRSGGTTSFGTYLSAAGGGTLNMNLGNKYDYTYNFYNGADGGSGGGISLYQNNYQIAWRYHELVRGGIGYQFGGGGINSINVGVGGNYGGNGGNKTIDAENGVNTIATIPESDVFNASAIGYGLGGGKWGGGGGYGANGGNGMYNSNRYIGGGGGGYGPAGYGGSANWIYGPGGGGAYGHGGSWGDPPTDGGGGAFRQAGADGICILQYYKKG